MHGVSPERAGVSDREKLLEAACLRLFEIIDQADRAAWMEWPLADAKMPDELNEMRRDARTVLREHGVPEPPWLVC